MQFPPLSNLAPGSSPLRNLVRSLFLITGLCISFVLQAGDFTGEQAIDEQSTEKKRIINEITKALSLNQVLMLAPLLFEKEVQAWVESRAVSYDGESDDGYAISIRQNLTERFVPKSINAEIEARLSQSFSLADLTAVREISRSPLLKLVKAKRQAVFDEKDSEAALDYQARLRAGKITQHRRQLIESVNIYTRESRLETILMLTLKKGLAIASGLPVTSATTAEAEIAERAAQIQNELNFYALRDFKSQDLLSVVALYKAPEMERFINQYEAVFLQALDLNGQGLRSSGSE